MATRTAAGKPGTDENVINLNFGGVAPRREGGKAAHVPPGDYLLEVVSAKNVPIKSGRNQGKRQIAWQYKIVDTAVDSAAARAGIGDSIYVNTQVEWADPAKQGWFLRNMLNDLLNTDVTGATNVKLQLDDKAGKRLGATLADGDEYQAKNADGELMFDDDGNAVMRIRSEIKYTFPASKFVPASGEDVEEAAPAPKAAKNGASSAQEAAVAVTEADEDEDVEELDVQSL